MLYKIIPRGTHLPVERQEVLIRLPTHKHLSDVGR
jgi:hypothetical protein